MHFNSQRSPVSKRGIPDSTGGFCSQGRTRLSLLLKDT